MAAARIATVLACSSEHVSPIETGAALAAHRHTIDAALLSQLMSPASIGNDALAYLIKTYQRAHRNGEPPAPPAAAALPAEWLPRRPRVRRVALVLSGTRRARSSARRAPSLILLCAKGRC